MCTKKLKSYKLLLLKFILRIYSPLYVFESRATNAKTLNATIKPIKLRISIVKSD